MCRRYNADKKIIGGTGAGYALLAAWGLMLPLTAGTRPVIGGETMKVVAFVIDKLQLKAFGAILSVQIAVISTATPQAAIIS